MLTEFYLGRETIQAMGETKMKFHKFWPAKGLVIHVTKVNDKDALHIHVI